MAKFTKLNIGDAVASSGGRVWKKLSSMLQLSAPTLSLDGDTLTITDDSKLATSFDILADGEVKGTATSATFDLSTLELQEGTYSITAISKADGYINSAESEAVSYEIDNSIVGTWLLNKDLIKIGSFSDQYTGSIGGHAFEYIWLAGSGGSTYIKFGPYYAAKEGVTIYTPAYTVSGTKRYGGINNPSWATIPYNDVDEGDTYYGYRTLVINSVIEGGNGVFAAWLKANATKIA